MQLNKTGMDTVKTAGIPEKNIPLKNTGQTQANVQSKTIDTQSARSVASLVASSGLPQDKLTASVLSFARFFSIALKPENLAAIRRQAFSAHNMPSAQNTEAQTARETSAARQLTGNRFLRETQTVEGKLPFALAAAAAESKGVELRSEALELYVKAVDPDQDRRQGGEDRGKEKGNKEQNGHEEKDKNISAADIKKLALETAENNLVLSIMNRLPCKNGRRWIALPFEFSRKEKDYKVSMRALMEGNNVVFMALDIFTLNENRRSFAIEFLYNKVNKLIYYTREKTEISAKKELADIFNMPIENIFLKDGDDFSIPEADYGEELLRFIDEAV